MNALFHPQIFVDPCHCYHFILEQPLHLTQHIFIFSQSWYWEVQDPGSGAGAGGASLWAADKIQGQWQGGPGDLPNPEIEPTSPAKPPVKSSMYLILHKLIVLN